MTANIGAASPSRLGRPGNPKPLEESGGALIDAALEHGDVDSVSLHPTPENVEA